jgi:cytochrome c553
MRFPATCSIGERMVGFRHWRHQALPGDAGGRHRAVTRIGTQLTLLVAFPVAAATIGRAEKAAELSDAALQAKLNYCENCHGRSGRGFHGYYPIPRLAGQQAAYFENQLKAFTEHRRTNVIMFNVAHVLSPEMIASLIEKFGALDPKPLGGGPKELVPTGQKIYQEGVTEAGIPPCASCHGPQAKGEAEFPRLAGQLYDYLVNKLTHWSQERGQKPDQPDSSAIMEPIAHGLTEPQIKAVAAYVSYLE